MVSIYALMNWVRGRTEGKREDDDCGERDGSEHELNTDAASQPDGDATFEPDGDAASVPDGDSFSKLAILLGFRRISAGESCVLAR